MMTKRQIVPALAMALALGAGATASAQQTRAGLLETAAGFIPADSAEGLLYLALHPDSGFGDAAWTGGIMLLAELLNADGRFNAAAVWLRWAVRLAPHLQPDTLLWTPETNQMFRDAVAFVGADTALGRTRWSWPVNRDATTGNVRLGAPSPATAAVLVLGYGGAVGQSVSLPVGSYQVQGSAPGYVATTVTREVLPGVTTTVDLALPALVAPTPPEPPDSVLPDDVRDAVLARSGRVTIQRLGRPVCSAGLLLPGGLLLTTYEAIRGAESAVGAGLPGGVEGAVQVAAWDVEGNLAVLAAGVDPAVGAADTAGPAGDSLGLVDSLDGGQNVWGVGLVDCTSGIASRARVESWGGGLSDPVTLSRSFINAGTGSPVFDRSGAFVGLVTDAGTVIPGARAASLIEDASENLAGDDLRSVAEVMQRERHVYGTARITSDSANSTVRVVPLEEWHWTGLGGEQALPATFEGPIGRYALEWMVNGAAVERIEIELPAGVPQQYALVPQVGGGGFPVAIVVGILAAGGGAACLLAICKSDPGTQPPPNGGTGGIEVTFPIRE